MRATFGPTRVHEAPESKDEKGENWPKQRCTIDEENEVGERDSKGLWSRDYSWCENCGGVSTNTRDEQGNLRRNCQNDSVVWNGQLYEGQDPNNRHLMTSISRIRYFYFFSCRAACH